MSQFDSNKIFEKKLNKKKTRIKNKKNQKLLLKKYLKKLNYN